MKNKNVIMIGGFLQDDFIDYYISKSKFPYENAASNLQKKIIDGFIKNDYNISFINTRLIKPYSKNNKILKCNYTTSKYKDKVDLFNLGFLNLKLLNHFSILKSLKMIFKNKKFDAESILIYSAYFPYIKLASYLKKNKYNMNITLIVPDLPKYMGLNSKKSIYNKFALFISNKIVLKNLSSIDSFVYLTKHMNNVLNIYNKPYIIMEGIADEREFNEYNYSSDLSKKILLYTGSLQYMYGIKDLLEAFELTHNDNFQLIICGQGEAESEVIKYCNIDSRIKYLGNIDKNEIMKLQLRATALINPRKNNNDFTKYSFPSKNLEYLSSGNPVIAYKLDGIPDKYDLHFIYVEDDKPETLARVVEKTLLLSEEEKKHIHDINIRFVSSLKSNEQVYRIIKLMMEK